jgi:hypothetical protein
MQRFVLDAAVIYPIVTGKGNLSLPASVATTIMYEREPFGKQPPLLLASGEIANLSVAIPSHIIFFFAASGTLDL